jgi:uncharacterized protein YyaL (SSP411 family)
MAEDIFKAVKPLLDTYPPGAGYHLLALQRYYDEKAPTVVVALDENKSSHSEIRRALRENSHPHLVTIWKHKEDLLLPRLVPWLEDKQPLRQTTVYICQQDRCLAPLQEKQDILAAIEKL